MTATKSEVDLARGAARIETVDNWHRAWPLVLQEFERSGTRGKLMLDRDGWLSARQVVLAAFVGKNVAGHFCFHVEPGKRKSCVQARVDSCGINPGQTDRGLGKRLLAAAVRRARELRCTERVGFELGRRWK